MARVAVMGSGSWGTALAKVLADAGNDVVMWARREQLAEMIATRHENADYLPGVPLPASIRATTDHAAALRGAEIVVLAVPSQTLRENLAVWRDHIPADASLVSIAKGIETGTLMRMSEVVGEVSGVGAERIAVLSGPNLAKEIAAEQPAATVIACVDESRARALQAAFNAPYFRPYTNTDVIGCEIGGACKNVIALGCGIASGLGFGENTLATLITRGLAEITRLGMRLGANPATFAGLAGLGDLVATCSSPLSRNRTFGFHLGEGYTLEEAQAASHGQVAEGVKSCGSIRALSRTNGVEMPITEAVYAVCQGDLSVHDLSGLLLGRRTKPEFPRGL